MEQVSMTGERELEQTLKAAAAIRRIQEVSPKRLPDVEVARHFEEMRRERELAGAASIIDDIQGSQRILRDQRFSEALTDLEHRHSVLRMIDNPTELQTSHRFRMLNPEVQTWLETHKYAMSHAALVATAERALLEMARLRTPLDERTFGRAFDDVILRRLGFGAWTEILRGDELLDVAPPVLYDARGNPLHEIEDSKPLKATVEAVSEALLVALGRDPNELYRLTPRRFEEVVAELVARMGVEVTLTPAKNDGGKDIIAVMRRPLIGAWTVYIECKKLGAHRKVGVELVSHLYGVVNHDEVAGGVLVTTSSFTRGATKFAERHPNRLGLRAFQDLAEVLRGGSAAWFGSAIAGSEGRDDRNPSA